MSRKYNSKGISSIFILLFVVIVMGVALYFVIQNLNLTLPQTTSDQNQDNIALTDSTPKPSQTVATAKPEPTRSPIPLKPDDGTKGTYQVGMGTHTGPTITQVVFDPLDVQKGQVLKVTIKAYYTSPISSITATLGTDNSSQEMQFKLIAGSTTDGQWSGSTTLQDSVSYNYNLTVKAKSADGKSSSVIITPR